MPGLTSITISSARRQKQAGQTILIFTMLCTLLLIPIAGLAVDGAIVYLMKAKLSSAVDAAALATARGLNAGQTLSAQENAATQTGTNYFAANMPSGMMGATLTNLSITFPTATVPNTMVVQVQATISVPLTFMRLLHFQTSSLTDIGQATRRVSNIILVLDRSYSLQLGGQCGNLISSAQKFVNLFAEGLDTMGLVDFQASANEDYQATANQKVFKTAINNYISQMQCSGYTNTAEALAVAYARLQKISQPSANNVIVLFTDGNADSIYASFPIRRVVGGKTPSDSLYNWSPVGNANPQKVQVGLSSCKSTVGSTLTGVISNLPGGLTNADDTGGVYVDTYHSGAPVPISWVSKYEAKNLYYPYPDTPVSGASCAFSGAQAANDAYPTSTVAIRNDVAYLPATDGNAPYDNNLVGYATQAADYYPATSLYKNQLRVDMTQSINDAALSDADNMATVIRTGVYGSTTSNVTATIYTIGLDNPPAEVVDSTFLERIANDPSAGAAYNSNQPTGMYKYCTPAGLQAAFVAIASQILRLSQPTPGSS